MTLRATGLFGRSQELELLRSLVDRVVDGRQQVAVIEGMGGIGKTHLLRETLAYAEACGVKALQGAADDLEQSRPFRAFLDAFDFASRGFSAGGAAELLIDDLVERPARGSDNVDSSYRIFETIADRLEALCIEGPLILALEDLHWADPSSVRAIRFVARRLSRLPLGLFVTLRPSPKQRQTELAVAELLQAGGTQIVLPPLDQEATMLLARDVLGAELGPNLGRQVLGSGATPLFVIEVLEALREEGAIELVEGRAEVGELTLPPSLRLTILRRMSFLPDATLDLLKIASILGQHFSLRDLSAITGRASVELLSALTEALRGGVLVDEQEWLSFRHDLIRGAIYEEIPMSARKDLHREAARALEAAGASVVRIAEQMSLGASRGDTEAVALLRRAAAETAPASAATAVRLLERALDLVDEQDPQRSEIRSELILPLIRVGRLEEAETLSRQALAEDLSVTTKVELERLLAIIVFHRGDRGRARELLRHRAAASDAGEQERATDTAMAALASMYDADLAEAYELAERGRALGRETGNTSAILMSLTTLSGVARFRGWAEQAVLLGREAVGFGEHPSGAWGAFVVRPRLLLGAACLDADRLDEAEDALRAGLADRRAVQWDVPMHQMYLAARNFLGGQWDDALAEAEAGLSFVEDLEFSPFAAVLLSQGLVAAISIYRGDLERAGSALEQAEQELAKSGPQLGVDTMVWAKALFVEAHGDPAQALSLLVGVWSLYRTFGYQLAHRWVAADLVRLAIQTGDLKIAHEVVPELEELATQAQVATTQGLALRARGLLEDDPEVLVAAVGAFDRGPRPFEGAQARQDAAFCLQRHRRSADARRLLDEAFSVYADVGATRAIDGAEARARSHGLRRGRRGTRGRPKLGWESLTPTELRVAGLVSKGLTNRSIGQEMFISPRTVETHVSHLFAKLDVASRSELAAVAGRHLG